MDGKSLGKCFLLIGHEKFILMSNFLFFVGDEEWVDLHGEKFTSNWSVRS